MDTWLRLPPFDATDGLTRGHGSANVDVEDTSRISVTSIEDVVLPESDTPFLNKLYPYLE